VKPGLALPPFSSQPALKWGYKNTQKWDIHISTKNIPPVAGNALEIFEV
jgi:hypothetical protein